ncbi:MAG TPA: Ig-like domain-containing protein, partial [Gemmatimonadales bacterium]|nr:Ig-like domain-containing protein [Gemmatimonadales bacterium]
MSRTPGRLRQSTVTTVLRLGAALLLAVAVATCSDEHLGGPSRGGAGYFGFRPVTHLSSPPATFGIVIDSVHIRLTRPPTNLLVLDTTAAFPADSSALKLALLVPLSQQAETLTALIELKASGLVVFSGTQDVVVVNGPPGSSPPPSISLAFVGPGKTTDSIRIAPRDTAIKLGDSLRFRASAWDSSGAALAQFYAGWTSNDTTLAKINATGLLRAPTHRGTVKIIATTPTGIADTTSVTFVPTATLLAKAGGDGQTGTVGASPAAPLLVQARAADSLGVAGVAVKFTALAAGASVAESLAVTDSLGHAATAVTLGPTAGPQRFVAQAGALAPDTFTITAGAGAAAAIAIQAGNAQTDTTDLALPAPLAVKVTDAFGNAASGAKVAWVRVAGRGTLATDTSASDSTGLATVGYTLGALAGTDTVSATLAGTSAKVTFTATAITAAAASVAVVSGNAQADTVGKALPQPLVVFVADGRGKLVAGARVIWSSKFGGGTFAADTVLTDTTGHAQATYTLGSVAVTDTVVATIACGCTATFTASALPAAAALIAIQGGNGQTDTVSTALPTALSVKVTDAFGNAVNGVVVHWTILAGSGSLSADSSATAGTGIAQVSYTLGNVPQMDSIKATLGAGPATVTFTATSVAPAPAAIAIVSGNAQTDTVGLTLPQPLVVAVTGGGGRPVAGTSVAFASKSGRGKFGGRVADTVTTDTLGRAQVAFTLDTLAGPDSVFGKTVVGGYAVAFGVTAIAGAPVTINSVAGNIQSDTARATLPNPLVVFVSDAHGNPVAGAHVVWTVTLGSGTFGGLSTDTITTAANGQASVSFTLGATAGTNNVKATVQETGAPVTFTETTLSGAAAAISLVSGNAQTDTVGATLPSPLVVRVADGSNNPVANAKVYWTRIAGTGTVSADSTVTNASGQSQITFALGATAGADTIRAALPSVDSVRFTATATAGAPAAIAATGGNGQSGTTGSVLPNPLTVRVTDAHSNPVPGISVTWAVTAGGGTIGGVTATTDATGTSTVAQWTLGGTAGTDSATATVNGVSGSPVVFTAVALPLAATKSWTGSAGTSWATAGSWNPTGVPTLSDNVFIPASAPSPVVAATTTVGGLQTETGVTLTINAGDTLSTLGTVLVPAGATVTGSGALALAGTNQQVSGAFGTVAVTGTPLLSGASTVSGPLSVTSSGALTLNGHPLTVGGAVSLAGSGRLVMTNSADSLDVAGLFTANGAPTGTDLTAGTLVLRGGFAQGSGFTNNFAPAATHTTVFAGSGAQSVTFAYPGLTQSHFGTLVVNDPAGVTLASNVSAAGTVTLTSGAVTGTGRAGILGGGLVDAAAGWHVDSTTLAATAAVPLPDSIAGQVTVTGTIGLATGLKVNGGLALAGTGTLTPAGHPLTVTGAMTLSGSSQLVMTNATDTVDVGGLFTANGGQTGANLSAGKLVLRGGFTQGSNFANDFAPSGTHRTVFAGAVAQSVNFYSAAAAASHFQDVTFDDAAGVTFAAPVAVNGSVAVLGGIVTGASQAATIGGNLSDAGGAGWQVGTTIFTGSPALPDSIASNVAVQGAMTLARPFLVKGTLALTNSGTLTVNGHRLTVTGAISTSNSSHLLMRNAADTVDVGGGFSANGGADNHDLTNGLLIVRGDFAQGTSFANNFAAESLHVTRFAGTATQNVAFAFPLNSHFQNVEFDNPAGVQFTSDVAANGTATILAGTVTGAGKAGTIGANLVDASNSAWKVDTTIFTGSPVLPDSFSGAVHFQGPVTLTRALKVIGSVAVDGTGGALTLGGFPLTVTGAFATGGSGHLRMTSAADSLDVGGAYTADGATSTGDLTAGVIVMRGNFTQGNAFSDDFAPGGTHRVRFAGSAAQSVSFSYPLNSHLQDAVFDNPAGVSFASAATVAGSASVRRGAVTAAGHGVTVGADLSDTSNVSWRPDTTILAGAPAALPDSIQSTVDVTGTLALAKALRVKGALLVTGSGVLQPSGHPLAVTGAFATANSARFVMTNAADSVDVGGAFTANGGSSTGDLTAGVLVLRGNFAQGASSGTGFAASGTHRTRFQGSAAQALSFAYPATSHFQDVEFGSAGGVSATSSFAVAGTATVIGGTVTGTGRSATLAAGLADASGNGWRVDTTFFSAAPATLPDSIHSTVHFQAGATLAKRLRIVGGALVDGATGTLTPAGHAFFVTGQLQVLNGSQLAMLNPLDTVDVGGFRIATSASGAGLDTAGVLLVHGSFAQVAGTAANFQPSGSHITQFSPTGTDTVSFANPGLASSRFNRLSLAPAAGTVTLGSDVTVAGTFQKSAGAAPTLLGQGHLLSAAGLDLDGLVFDSLPLAKVGTAQVVRFDSVTFQHMDPAATQLTLSEAGAAGQQVFTNVRFTTAPGAGKYLQVADSAANGSPVDLAFDRSFPLNGSAATAVVNGNDGAIINWTTLVFAPGPQNDTTGVTLAPSIRAAAVGPLGDTLTTFTDTVTVAIGTNPVGGTLTGTLKRAAVGGVATFNDLVITGVGNGYTLTAATPQLPTITSALFNIGIFVPAGTSAIWSGGTDSVWTTASNWQGGVVPDSASNVLIPSGTAHSPVIQLGGTGRVNRLTLQSGATLAIDSLATLYADSSVSNAGTVTGMGTLSLKGAGTVSGQLGGVQVTGNYAVDPAASMQAAGNLTILGAAARLDLNGRRGLVGRTLLVTSGGVLAMTHAGDTLDVAANAQFSGGNEAGLLTNGVLAVAGNFTEGFGDPHAFAASGAHLTRLDG